MQNTIDKLKEAREDYDTSDSPFADALCEAVLSLARRVRKLERAAKETARVTPERKVKQERLPLLQAGFNYMSEDVLITVIDTPQFVGYYNYRDRQWMVYTAEDASVPFNRPVKSWQYLPNGTPQAEAPAGWISVQERLPKIRRNYSGMSDNVLVRIAEEARDEDCYIGYYNYMHKLWEVKGRHGTVTHWQPLPSAPND